MSYWKNLTFEVSHPEMKDLELESLGQLHKDVARLLKESPGACPIIAIAKPLWGAMLSSEPFHQMFVPSCDPADLVEGRLGRLFGIEVVTDAYELATRDRLPAGVHIGYRAS